MLTLRTRSSAEISKKIEIFTVLKKLKSSLYWFAAQQQTSTFRRQKSRSIYSKFSVEENELTLSFQNPQEVA